MTAAMERVLTIFFFKSNSITPKAYKLSTKEISDHYPLIVVVDNVTIKQVNNRLNNFINYKKLLIKLIQQNGILYCQYMVETEQSIR